MNFRCLDTLDVLTQHWALLKLCVGGSRRLNFTKKKKKKKKNTSNIMPLKYKTEIINKINYDRKSK